MTWSILVGTAILVVPLVIFVHIWAMPIAKLWYRSGFEDAVAVALKEIPSSDDACIYDDAQGMFVTSIDQLDVDRMIEKAVWDKAPRVRLNVSARDPHFRVYSDGSTYYWSFNDQKFYVFGRNRDGLWSLTRLGRGLCDAYRQAPERMRRAFLDLNGIVVTEQNFCCVADSGF